MVPVEREPLKHNSGGGKCREMFVVGPQKDHVAKIPKEIIEKKCPFGTVHYSSAPYTLLKFGKANINEADFENYQALPEVVRNTYAPSTRMIQGVIVQERVMDFDGSPSLSMEEHTRKYGKIDNDFFWRKIDELKELFLSEEKPLLGVFQKGSNIMIKRVSENKLVPVIVDFKRLGARSYPFQPNLALPGEVQKKFMRQFEQFEKNYRPVQRER
jgi:hypothetical protein